MSNDLVVFVVENLERLGIDYMLVGSYSSNAFGIARSTQDADFVIQIDERMIRPLFDALLPELRFDPQMQLETTTMTLRWKGTHAGSGFVVELFLTSDDPHDRERFARRKRQPLLGRMVFLPSAEDVVVQKLRWFHRANRTKDRDDAENVLHVQSGKLDLEYVSNWCDRHGTRQLLTDMLASISD